MDVALLYTCNQGSTRDDEEEGQRRRLNLPEQCVRLLEGFRRLDGARVRRSVIYV